MVGPLGLSDHEIPPEPDLFDPVEGGQLCEIILDEVLDEGDHKFGVFADDLDILGGLDGNGLVMVAAFIMPNHDLVVDVIANGKLTLAPVPLPALLALYKLVKLQLLKFLVLFYPAAYFTILKELAIIVFNDSVYIFYFGLDLLRVGEGMKRTYYVLYFCVPNLLPLLLSGCHFPLLSSLGALLYRNEIFLICDHPFLGSFDPDTFVEGVLAIEVFRDNWLVEADQEE